MASSHHRPEPDTGLHARPAPPTRGAVAALQQPLAQAERAAALADWPRVAQLLRPPMRDFGATLGSGRMFELWGLCGAEGVRGLEPHAALVRALHAYQDEHAVAGMARTHFALAELALGRCSLATAEREYGYASQLFARHGTPHERVACLAAQAFASLQQAELGRGLEQSDAALQLCRQLDADAATEAEARLVRAQAFAAAGEAQASARDLLWAERLLAPLGAQVPHAVLLRRAESLLGLGYPRRALSVLRARRVARAEAEGRPTGGAETDAAVPMWEQPPGPRAQAHALRLEGEASLGDGPAAALALLQQARQRFVALNQPYFRLVCELSMARAMHRSGHPGLQACMDALGSARLGRWPRLAGAYRLLLQELERPEAHVPGAVRTPWARAVGHHTGRISMPAQADAPAQEPAAAAQPGFVGRLQGAWSRLRGSQDAV